MLDLRPGDLYATYNLYRLAKTAGDADAATTYSETLVYFPLEAVHPTDERLLGYVAEAIPALLEDGLWDRDKTLNVVSFLVWQHNGAAGVERLLEQLSERYPAEPDWSFYLAELYHRRGNLDQAAAAYRRVLAMAPDYAQAYLRLGMAAEERGRERLEEAARWYEQYHALAPDDLLGLKRLAEVCAALEQAGVEDESCGEAAALREELEARTGDRRIVAELLGVPVEEVELGPNLVENGGFEEWVEGKPKGWYWSNMATGNPWNLAVFQGGEDRGSYYEKEDGMRVEGLWLQADPDLQLARAGFWHRKDIVVPPATLYLLSFHYRTDELGKAAATIWRPRMTVIFSILETIGCLPQMAIGVQSLRYYGTEE